LVVGGGDEEGYEGCWLAIVRMDSKTAGRIGFPVGWNGLCKSSRGKKGKGLNWLRERRQYQTTYLRNEVQRTRGSGARRCRQLIQDECIIACQRRPETVALLEDISMEDRDFDSLTRQVGEQADRRTMVKTALGGTLALLGIGGLSRQSEARNNNNNKNNGKNNRRANQTGYEDDPCATSADCLKGLRCQGARAGIDPGFPTLIDLPVITGKPGRCRYKKSCGGEQGDACKRKDDCCSNGGQNLTCDNNRCKKKS
jgi:hypothetical protein